MNPHIELVKKWLDDPKSVSAEELERNIHAAYAAADAVYTAHTTKVNNAADADADAADANTPNSPKYWVNKYEELTK